MSDEQKTGATEREGLRACETCRYIDNMESGMNEPCLTCQRVGNYYLWSEDVPTRAADDNGRDYKIKALERMRVELSDAHVLNKDQAAEIGRLTYAADAWADEMTASIKERDDLREKLDAASAALKRIRSARGGPDHEAYYNADCVAQKALVEINGSGEPQ